MNIGFLTPEYLMVRRLDGGLANYLYKVSQALAARKNKVIIFLLSDRDYRWEDGKVTVIEVKSLSITLLRRVRKLIFFLPILEQLISIRRLAVAVWQEHEKVGFDILHASSYKAPGFFLRCNGLIPLVSRASSYAPLWRSAYGRKSGLNEYIIDWIEKRQVIDSDGFISPSVFIANFYNKIGRKQVSVIRTPLDCTKILMDPSFYLSNLADIQYLLFFGTLSRIKGVDLLAEVIPKVIEKFPKIVFVFIGRDDCFPSGIKAMDYIKNATQSSDHNLRYFPAISKHQLYPVIENALGVLVPSRVDNYPNVCLEAHSFGVPVVGTYDSSIDEMVTDGVTGFLARNGDPDSLYKAIEKLLSLRPLQKKRMTEDILSHIKDIQEEDRISQLTAFYQSIIFRFKLSSK